MGLFGNKSSSTGSRAENVRVPRFSNGWVQLLKILKAEEGLRILDIGPTSAGNINLITQMGHSIYMANLPEEAAKPEWRVANPAEDEPPFDISGFLQHNLDFAGRAFDIVLLFDALDYVPEPFVQPIVNRIHEVLQAGGSLLGFFHGKTTGDETTFSRYHLSETDHLELQRVGGLPVLHTFTNRQVEQIFANYSAYKFFLAKDALREVLVTR